MKVILNKQRVLFFAIAAITCSGIIFGDSTFSKAHACNSGLGIFDPTCPGRIFGRPNEDSGSDVNPVQAPRPTTSTIRFCNQSSGTVDAAYLSYDAPNGWQSHGWYNVQAGACRDVPIGRAYNGDIFVYAQNRNATWGNSGTTATFCVNTTQAFTIPNANQSCNGSDLKRVTGTKFSIRTGRNTWNITN